VPPNVCFTVLFSVLPLSVLQIVIFLTGKGAANFFLVAKGAVNQKRLKNTGLQRLLFSCLDFNVCNMNNDHLSTT